MLKGVLGNNNVGIKKCTTTFLWVLNLGQVGEILENFQNHPLGEGFGKKALQLQKFFTVQARHFDFFLVKKNSKFFQKF